MRSEPERIQIGASCIFRRPDSKGCGKHARIERVEPTLPFPIYIAGYWGGAWCLPIEIEPSRLA